MQATAPIQQSRVARYLQLATLFRNRISTGAWKVGDRVPSIAELADAFAVSRETIRGAMDVLHEEGLVDRFRAKGSFVRASPRAVASHRLAADWASLISAHEGAEIRVLENEVVTTLPGFEGLPAPLPEYRMMRRIHLKEGRAYLVGRLFVDPAIYAAGPPERFATEPTLPILHEVAGARIGRASQVLTVGTADVEIASLLGVALNAPIVQVERRALDLEGRPIYVGQGLYRGDAVRLEIDLR